MAKIVTRYFDDDAPAGCKADDSIVVPVGNFVVVAIPVPAEGRVTRLTVKQDGGTPKAFTADLVESSGVYTVGEHLNADTAQLDLDIYSIIAQQSATAGNAAQYKSDQGQAYRNAEAQSVTQTSDRNIYLILKPTSAVDDTSWKVSVTVFSEVG